MAIMNEKSYGLLKSSDTLNDKPKVTIYTDGSWKGKIQSGGWSALLTYQDEWKLISAGREETTVNRMELTAVLEALKLLKEPCIVKIISDSQLTCNTINGYIWHWIKNGFITSSGSPVLNRDILDQLIPLLQYHKVRAYWVKSHTGKDDMDSICNDICDYWAQYSATNAHNQACGKLSDIRRNNNANIQIANGRKTENSSRYRKGRKKLRWRKFLSLR